MSNTTNNDGLSNTAGNTSTAVNSVDRAAANKQVNVLEVKDLSVEFTTRHGTLKALNEVSFTIGFVCHSKIFADIRFTRIL